MMLMKQLPHIVLLQTRIDMFDFHTHILPKMDDGSRSVEESLALLNELKLQGVDGVAATPHFYADRSSPETFFEQRSSAWEKLKPYIRFEMPQVRLGAEVRYFEGIARYDGLERFCIEGSNLLLLEMPQGTWTRRMIATVVELNESRNISVLMAHIERYHRDQPKDIWKHLLRCGIKMQVSADYVIDRKTRRTALNMLRDGSIHFLGSDCHNMTDRKPNMADAINIIQRKIGDDFLQNMRQRERMLLQEETGIGGG